MRDKKESFGGKEKTSTTTVAVACFTFFSFFSGALWLTVNDELKICRGCSTLGIYGPLVIADATVLLFVLLGLTYLFSEFRAPKLREDLR